MVNIMEIEKYLTHLPTCNKMQDWSEAEQAFADTPNEFRDDRYYIALKEMCYKQNICTCGMEQVREKISQLDVV